MTVADDWLPDARALAEELRQAGKVSSPEWYAAVAAVPRHRLVPDVYRQGPDGYWVRIDTGTEAGHRAWRKAVYSNQVLINAIRETGTGTEVVSSSSQPGLMTRMLEALDVRDGHRVLEIGTGTGYNAALVCHRLGDQDVYSVDVEPELVQTARSRLAALGYHPQLACVDGSVGLPEHAPYDRIIATCSVPRVPWSWVEQTRRGGVILVDLKLAVAAGNLVRLVRTEEGAQGRFDPTYAAFMALRSAGDGQGRPAPGRVPDLAAATRRHTSVDPRTPGNALVVWFLASLRLGPGVRHGYSGAAPGQPPSAVWITAADGSHTKIDLAAGGCGHLLTESGPRRLWSIVEAADTSWRALGQPGWERFGLTVRRDAQTVWLDDPDGEIRWSLPTST